MSTSSTEIAEFFKENGYYHAKGVYSQAEVAELEHDFDRIVRQLKSSGEQVEVIWQGEATKKLAPADSFVVHTHNVQIYSSAWMRALMQRHFLDGCRAILGDDVILHHTKLFQKPAEKGAPFPVHQDWTYFPSIKDTMMAAVIHVSRATDEMGCLRVVPGSHKLGRIPESSGQIPSEILDRYPLEESLAVEAEPGDVVFFHYLTLHGSFPNRSQSVRKTVLVQLYAGDDRIEDGNTHPNARLALSGWNSAAKRSLGEKS
jgi:ectoine hydroxylase-related dioxygenase (phytanoyl-CoA dioxygenase family)